jgi:hypothetical protein
MFLTANPNKGRPAEEKEETKTKYNPGEPVMPKIERRRKSSKERRAEEEDQRLMEEVRDMSLREVGIGPPRTRRRRADSRSDHARSSGGRNGDNRTDGRERRRRHAESDTETRTRRRRAPGSNSDPALVQGNTELRPDESSSNDRRRRSSREDTDRRHEETSRRAARQIEHQSSLRSLISSSDLDAHEMEEEILRQIQEEGLLDGIDLENIDVSQEDQISERIAQAFRRRQEARSGPVQEARNNAAPRSRERAHRSSRSRDSSGDNSRHRSAQHSHVRSNSAIGQSDERAGAVHVSPSSRLEVDTSDDNRRRRRTTSRNRSATLPVPTLSYGSSPATHSQTDLSSPSHAPESQNLRPATSSNNRSSTDPITRESVREPPSRPTRQELQNASPMSAGRSRSTGRTVETTNQIPGAFSAPRADEGINLFISSSPSSAVVTANDPLIPAPLSPRYPSRTSPTETLERAIAVSTAIRPTSSSSNASKNRSPLYPEPSITCARCSRPHIEYEVHFNCYICHGGNWDICLSCFRLGRGCLHWFGFGYTAWTKFERLIANGELPPNAEKPHMLSGNRYLPPKASQSGGADGRRTLTHDDPHNRLQSGAFCANCLAWANECYWRCDICNDNDWGYCNICVNQGRSCTHALLPLKYQPTDDYLPPLSPARGQESPSSATVLTGPGVPTFGGFRAMTFRTTCDICRYPIQPSSTRYHCYECRSSMPGTQPGDYDICSNCYTNLGVTRKISAENGKDGWRRCLQGHRMVVVGFEDKDGGQRRVVVQDRVGGKALVNEPFQSNSSPPCMKWSWADGQYQRLVSMYVADTAPTAADGLMLTLRFPPDGGIGMRAVAMWAWYPQEGEGANELLFPRGAEIREVIDVNGDWYWGVYMGVGGLFPAPYVRVIDKGVSA